MSFCPNCGMENADTATECRRCHVPLEMQAQAEPEPAPAASDSEQLGEVCRRCEAYNEPGTPRCTTCGYKLIPDPGEEFEPIDPSQAEAQPEQAYEQPAEQYDSNIEVAAEAHEPSAAVAQEEAPLDHTPPSPAPAHVSESSPMEHGIPGLTGAYALSADEAFEASHAGPPEPHADMESALAAAELPLDHTPPDPSPAAKLAPPPPPKPSAPPPPVHAEPPPAARPASKSNIGLAAGAALAGAAVVGAGIAAAAASRSSAKSAPPPKPPAPPPPVQEAPSALADVPAAAPSAPPVSAEKTCPDCGTPNLPAAKFCAECGTPFKAAPKAAKPAPAAAPPPKAEPAPPPPKAEPPPKPEAHAARPAPKDGARPRSDMAVHTTEPSQPKVDAFPRRIAPVAAEKAPQPSTDPGSIVVADEPEPTSVDEQSVETLLPADDNNLEAMRTGESPRLEEVSEAAEIVEVAPAQREAPFSVSLVVERGSAVGTSFVLAHYESTFGGPGAAVSLADDPHLAPHAATFLFEDPENPGASRTLLRDEGAEPTADAPHVEGMRYVTSDEHPAQSQRLLLRDEGSANGVFVKVKGSIRLEPGDTFAAGERLLRFDGTQELPAPIEGEVPVLGSPRPQGERTVRVAEVLMGGQTGRTCFRAGPVIAVGRTGCDMNFPGDPLLAARHAEIRLDEGGNALLCDLGASPEGLYVRLRPQTEYELSAGALVRVGGQLLKVEMG